MLENIMFNVVTKISSVVVEVFFSPLHGLSSCQAVSANTSLKCQFNQIFIFRFLNFSKRNNVQTVFQSDQRKTVFFSAVRGFHKI